MKIKKDVTEKKPVSEKSALRKEIKQKYIKRAAKISLTPEQFKMYVTNIYSFDESKTKQFNQWRASISNNKIKYDVLFPEIQRLRRIENKTEGNKTKIANLIKEALVRQINLTFEKNGDDTRVTLKNVEEHIYNLAKESYDNDMPAQYLEIAIADRIKDVEKYLEENHKELFNWCKEVRGLGTKLAAKLIAGIGDIRRFPNPSSLCSYCGVGDAAKSERVKGQKLKHSPKMRATLFNLGESFIKANSQYRIKYDKRKEITLSTHPEWHNLVPCPIKNVGDKAPKTDENGVVTWSNQHPKHAHIDATRVMVKRFLHELFVAWYQSLGLEPPSKPFGVEIQGHHEDPPIVPFKGTRHIIEFSNVSVGNAEGYHDDENLISDFENLEEYKDKFVIFMGDAI
jgi:hypothetical protein